MSDLVDNDGKTAAGQTSGQDDLESRVLGQSIAELKALAADSRLTEDLALAMLSRRDLTAEIIETLTKNTAVMQHRRVHFAVVAHSKTPRHISVPAVRQLYAFELMQLVLSPAALADIKRAAEDGIISRLDKITLGERLTLARRASGRIAASLLLDPDRRVTEGALDNPFLTEVLVVRAVLQEKASPALVEMVSRHAKWSVRREIRISLVRSRKTKPLYVAEFVRSFPSGVLRDLLKDSRLPENAKDCVKNELQNRTGA